MPDSLAFMRALPSDFYGVIFVEAEEINLGFPW